MLCYRGGLEFTNVQHNLNREARGRMVLGTTFGPTGLSALVAYSDPQKVFVDVTVTDVGFCHDQASRRANPVPQIRS